jgi:hypothetical protein
MLEVGPGFQLGPNALSRIYATSSSGAEVPLSEFATIYMDRLGHWLGRETAGRPNSSRAMRETPG